MKKIIVLLMLLPTLLTGCTNGNGIDSSNQTSTKNISEWTYQSGDKPVKIINHDNPTTIKESEFKYSHINYGGLDKLQRTKAVTAYLTKNNLGHSNTRTRQIWRPTGWHNQPKYIDGTRVIPQNRGHLIAYTVTFNLNNKGQEQVGELGSIDNPYNLFTQTEFSNQQTMTQVEQKVRTALAQNKKVIYKVEPIFRGNELMVRGVWVQALTTDGSMKFNRYLFNVQDRIKFDYATGRSVVDYKLRVPAVENQATYYKHAYHPKYRH